MKVHLLQCFSAALLFVTGAAARAETAFTFNIRDVNGNTVSLANGHVTVVSIVNRGNQHDARVVADRVPRRYYGDERLQMIVVGTLQKKIPGLFHNFVLALFRRRVELEARRLQPIYQSRAVKRDPRGDIHLVPDFTGDEAARFDVPISDNRLRVYLLGRDGRVLADWRRIPESEEMAAALDAVLQRQ